MSENLIIDVGSASKRFAEVVAVDDLSFAVERGQIFALLGPNGAGKSTTVRMLTGMTLPDSGVITYRFASATTRTTPESGTRQLPRHLIGYLPEERGLYADKSVIDNLVYFASLRGMEPAAARAAAAGWLERFGLAERSNDKISSLSKGNQQKVQFVAAVLPGPELAILDEPFSGFDPVNQDLVVRMITGLRNAGMTVILSAHQMDLVESLADYILLMHQGRAVLRGTMPQIRAEAALGSRLVFTTAEGTGALDQAALRSLPGVERVGVPEPGAGTVRDVPAEDGTGASGRHGDHRSAWVDLTPGAQVGPTLRALSELVTLTDVRTETPTLRDIYLEAVGARGGGATAPYSAQTDAGAAEQANGGRP